MMTTEKFSHHESRLIYSTLIILILSIAAVCWAVIAKHAPVIFIYTLPLLLFVVLQLVHIYFQHYVLGSQLRQTIHAVHTYPADVRKKWYNIFTAVSWLLIIVTIIIFMIFFKRLDIFLMILYGIDILTCMLMWINGRRFYYSDSSL